MPLLLKHQTPQQFIQRFREAYRNGERERVIQLARFIQARIAAGDFTDAQARTAFGLSAIQWNALKAKMKTFTDADAVTRSAVGE